MINSMTFLNLNFFIFFFLTKLHCYYYRLFRQLADSSSVSNLPAGRQVLLSKSKYEQNRKAFSI